MNQGAIIRRIDAYFFIVLIRCVIGATLDQFSGAYLGGMEELRESYWLFFVETQLCVLQLRFFFCLFFF